MDWDTGSSSGANGADKFFSALFQTVSVRTAGFNVMDLSITQGATQWVYMIMMYISVYPVAISIRSTVKDDKTSDTTSEKLRYLLTRDLSIVLMAIFFLAWAEDSELKNDPQNFTMFKIIFEVVSGFGTVGLTLGNISDPTTSFSGAFSRIGKSIMIIVMLCGKHCGLPHFSDITIYIYEQDSMVSGDGPGEGRDDDGGAGGDGDGGVRQSRRMSEHSMMMMMNMMQSDPLMNRPDVPFEELHFDPHASPLYRPEDLVMNVVVLTGEREREREREREMGSLSVSQQREREKERERQSLSVSQQREREIQSLSVSQQRERESLSMSQQREREKERERRESVEQHVELRVSQDRGREREREKERQSPRETGEERERADVVGGTETEGEREDRERREKEKTN